MKLEISNKRKTGKFTKLWKINQYTFKQPVHQRKKLQGKLENILESNENNIAY